MKKQKEPDTKLAKMMAIMCPGETQRSIAKRVGISADLLGKQRFKGIKTLRVARRYAAVLGCDPMELIN